MGEIKKEYCFAYTGSEDIYLFTLSNAKGSRVCITNYGATITSFTTACAGNNFTDIVLGFDDPAGYLSPEYLAGNPYFGSAIGRYANRVKDGRFAIDGRQYDVTRNVGDNHLHGGHNGFDKKVWKLVSLTDAPYPSVTLEYKSADGEEGYPGELNVTLKFELNDQNELSYEFTAFCDQPSAVNLTHHSYFNLDLDKKSIDKHFVRILSPHILEQDNNLVVTGNLAPVAESMYDFRKFKQIGEDWNPVDGYDQSFVVDSSNRLSPVAEAYSEQSGLVLQVFTNEPIVHFYTGKWIPELKSVRGCCGPFSGFCFETQKHPNAINISHFPDTILRPGTSYNSKTTYRVSQV